MAVAALSVATVLAGEPERHGVTDPWVHDPVMAYEDGLTIISIVLVTASSA